MPSRRTCRTAPPASRPISPPTRPASSAFLSGNSAADQAYLQGGDSGLQAYLASNPTSLSAYLGGNTAAQQAYLQGGTAGLQAYLIGNPSILSAFLSGNSAADQAYLQGAATGLQAYLTGDPTVLQTYLNSGNTALQQYIAGDPTALQQFLTGSPASLQQYLATAPAALQSYLQQNATAVAQYLAANAVTQQAYLQANFAGVSAYILGDSDALSAYLGSDSAAQQAYLNGGTTGLQAYLTGNPTSLSAYLGDDNAADQDYLQGGDAGLQQYLATDPASLSAYLSSDQGADQAYLQGGASSLQAYLTSNPASLGAYLGSDSAANQAYLTNGSTGLQQYLATDPASLSAFLGNNPAANQAYLQGSATGLQGYLTGNPDGLQQYLLANPAVLQQYLTSSTTALQQYLTSSPAILQQYLNSNTAAQQAYIQQNVAGITAYLASNSTALNAFLAGDSAANQAYVSGDEAGLEAYLTSNPGDLQQYINSNSTVLQGYLTANPTVIQQYLASNATVLQQFIASNPTSLEQYLSANSTVLQQFLNTNPASLQQYLTSNPSALVQFLSSDPTQLQQFLVANPSVLQTFLGTNAQALQQTLNAAVLNLFRLNVTLPGSGNEATGGLLSTFNIGTGGTFTESITPAQLALLNQAVTSGASLADYAVNVTTQGGFNSLVGGLLSNVTAEGGGDNNIIIGDTSQLGLPSGTSVPGAALSMGGTFTGGGSNDTVYFVGGSATNPIGNVTLNEPAGASNDTLDFSNFTGGGVNINLSTTGKAQVVNATADLSITLPASGAFTNVVGSPGDDTIIGNGTNDILQGSALNNPNPNALPAVPPSTPSVQWVALNFTQFAPTVLSPTETFHNGNGSYSAVEQEEVLQALETIYAGLSPSIQFTIDPAEITQLRSMTTAQLAAIDLTPADVTTLASLVNPTFTNSVYENGNGNYVTVYYNDTPIFNNQPSPGGFSNEVDFGNLNQKTTVQLDVNGFLGTGPGLVPDSTADSMNGLPDFVNMSITISAHEAGHTLGLEHMDAIGPVGFGISSPPGGSSYYPAYGGTVGAFTTEGDVIASPASVGSTLVNAADGEAQLGERDAITLAFISDGTTVASDATDPSNPSWSGMPVPTVPAAQKATDPVQLDQDPDLPGVAGVPEAEGDVDSTNDNVAGVATTVIAQPVSLYDLNVPNPITTGFDAGMTFDVSAVDIDGYIGGTQPVLNASGKPVTDPKTSAAFTLSQPNYYTFTGQSGQLMSFQAMLTSVTSIKDPVDTVLTVYGPNGQVVAFNDDQFEPSDSSIFDVSLPLTGTYTVEVNAFHSTDPSFNDPSAQNYLPAAYYDAEHGAYELFMYTFSAQNATSGNDSIQYTAASPAVSTTPQVTMFDGSRPGYAVRRHRHLRDRSEPAPECRGEQLRRWVLVYGLSDDRDHGHLERSGRYLYRVADGGRSPGGDALHRAVLEPRWRHAHRDVLRRLGRFRQRSGHHGPDQRRNLYCRRIVRRRRQLRGLPRHDQLHDLTGDVDGHDRRRSHQDVRRHEQRHTDLGQLQPLGSGERPDLHGDPDRGHLQQPQCGHGDHGDRRPLRQQLHRRHGDAASNYTCRPQPPAPARSRPRP